MFLSPAVPSLLSLAHREGAAAHAGGFSLLNIGVLIIEQEDVVVVRVEADAVCLPHGSK